MRTTPIRHKRTMFCAICSITSCCWCGGFHVWPSGTLNLITVLASSRFFFVVRCGSCPSHKNLADTRLVWSGLLDSCDTRNLITALTPSRVILDSLALSHQVCGVTRSSVRQSENRNRNTFGHAFLNFFSLLFQRPPTRDAGAHTPAIRARGKLSSQTISCL